MRDIDRMIDEAIYEEEGELLRQIGEEPGFFSQFFSVFGGRTGWVNVLLMVVQTVLFVAGVWAAWMFFAAADPVSQLRFGLPAAVLLLMALMLKMMVWPAFQTNRLLREMKLIQLQLARRGDVEGSSK
ncbi:hypothetical protein GRZ55_19735 [Chelativorans sp. ZYF759]|uniref:DUF6768 family protein n=1 Tax=Chelativorans sp. ZYF759 TaxID=2692213 RepID=UPI00145F2952|nr:DUF6768 family protein [Chelativorans sp. ZYF759]NMG41477.1 hypothetical protein [Chelativorans sp. ZYF759]